MTARYLLCPFWTTSRTDGDGHFIGAAQLAHLYGVRMDDCLVLPLSTSNNPAEMFRRIELLGRTDLIRLHPRASGDYTLPEPRPAAAAANPYGCHNHQPYVPAVHVQDGWNTVSNMATREPRMIGVEVRGATDCQYTLTRLGQADKRCTGCRWRAAPGHPGSGQKAGET